VRRALAVAIAAVASLSTGVATDAAPVDVSLRIEGSAGTLYEGPLRTDAQTVDGGDGTGPHPCGAGSPSVLGALSDAAAAGGFGWRGVWNPDFQDFFVNRIGADSSNPGTASYWTVLVNRRYTGGGCATGVDPGDEVLWAYDTANRPLILSLVGPTSAAIGEPVTVTVRDGWIRGDTGLDGGPVAGAAVGGAVTDAAGRATLRFATAGLKRLKARRGDAIRSNTLDVCVGNAACESALPPPPAGGATGLRIAKIAPGDRFARGRGPRILRGAATGPVELSLRRVDRDGRCSSWEAAKRSLRAERCGARPLSFAASMAAGGRWHRRLAATLPPGRYTLSSAAGARSVRVRFSIARSPLTLAATSRRARRYLVRAEARGGGFGLAPGSSAAPLYTGWAAIALADQPTRRSRPVLGRARAVLLSARMRPGSLADLERGALALEGTERLAERRTLRAWRSAIARRQRHDGSFAGQTSPTAFAVLALRGSRAHRPTVRRARAWLVDQQLHDGGFAAGSGGEVSDADTTGAALWALGRHTGRGVRAATRLLRSRQNPDGGFGATAGTPSDAQSTALAILGLHGSGLDPRRMRTEDRISPVDYLRARSRSDGSIAYALGDTRSPIWVTAQALAALIGRQELG
jgi:hypothetical protein